jgi:hypothetical protein
MNSFLSIRTCAAATLAIAAVATGSPRAAAASTSSPLRQAIFNTNSALSYRQDDTGKSILGDLRMSEKSWEVYDQRHNRERDHAEITLAVPGKKTQHYYVDVVMLNNHTYYRSSLGSAGWKVQKGYGYTDPVSGQRWFRSPLNFAYLEQSPIASQGRAANGTYHVRFRSQSSKKVKATGGQDVWISTRGKPYIVRYTINVAATVKGKHASQVEDTRLSKFNQPVSISAPKLGT